MKCTYCAVGSGAVKYRVRSKERILQEIETAVFEHDARFIDFEDENLSLDRKDFLELLDGISSRFQGLDLELRAMNGLFTPALDDAVIHAMKAAGFRTLNLSLGTTSPDQLRRFRRPDVRAATASAIAAARKHGLDVVCYIIVGAPGQSARASLKDLIYLAGRDVLPGVSVYYPAPGSADYAMLENRGMLPAHASLMRSSAIPVSHRTTRLESVTLLRLGRILGFIRHLRHRGCPLPQPASHLESRLAPQADRDAVGEYLLARFLRDARIRGLTPQGEIYEHHIARALTLPFRAALQRIYT
jgi:radical SAM superfamily enzyme YgiQ (UPF0313 family)